MKKYQNLFLKILFAILPTLGIGFIIEALIELAFISIVESSYKGSIVAPPDIYEFPLFMLFATVIGYSIAGLISYTVISYITKDRTKDSVVKMETSSETVIEKKIDSKLLKFLKINFFFFSPNLIAIFSSMAIDNLMFSLVYFVMTPYYEGKEEWLGHDVWEVGMSVWFDLIKLLIVLLSTISFVLVLDKVFQESKTKELKMIPRFWGSLLIFVPLMIVRLVCDYFESNLYISLGKENLLVGLIVISTMSYLSLLYWITKRNYDLNQ